MIGTSRQARNHIAEWSEFFKDLKTVTESAVEEFLKTREKNKYLKQSLERFIENGLVEKRKDRLFISNKGRVFFQQHSIKSRLADIKSWDGKWRLITFDVPNEFNKERYRLRYLLKYFGFYQLQKSAWIYPNHLSEELWKLLVDLELAKYCKVMIVEFLEQDKELRDHFKFLLSK
jgi:DNA-binding transcriptional regulator PaaX